MYAFLQVYVGLYLGCFWKKKKIFKGTDVICTEIVSSTEIKSSVVKRLKDLEKIRKEKTKKQNKTKPV